MYGVVQRSNRIGRHGPARSSKRLAMRSESVTSRSEARSPPYGRRPEPIGSNIMAAAGGTVRLKTSLSGRGTMSERYLQPGSISEESDRGNREALSYLCDPRAELSWPLAPARPASSPEAPSTPFLDSCFHVPMAQSHMRLQPPAAPWASALEGLLSATSTAAACAANARSDDACAQIHNRCRSKPR